jgi:hypothetical protein
MSERRVEKKLRFHPKFGDLLELVVYIWQIQTFFSLQYGDVGPFFPQKKKTKSFVYESHTTLFCHHIRQNNIYKWVIINEPMEGNPRLRIFSLN